jgi:hypothetical protein
MMTQVERDLLFLLSGIAVGIVFTCVALSTLP